MKFFRLDSDWSFDVGVCIVLVTCLGSLRHSMFSQLSWQDESNGSLDLSRSHGLLLVVGVEFP